MQWMLIWAVGCRPDFKLWCLKSANSCSGCTLYHTNIIDAIRQRLCATPTCELQTYTLPMPLHFITFSASYKRAKTRQMATPSDQWRPLNDIMDMSNSEHMFVLHLKDMQIKSNFSQVSPKKNHWKSIGQHINEGQMISVTEQRGLCSTVEAISTASFKAHCFANTITMSWPEQIMSRSHTG